MIELKGKFNTAKIFTDIVDEMIKGMKLHVVDQFTTIHNYIDTDAMILRKGNDDWNRSAPHGAGRLMSRAQAKQSFTVNSFKKEMDDILNNIGDTAEVVKIIRPIYNFKAGDEKLCRVAAHD